MNGDILVKPGAKLVIERGTELNFLNGVGMLVLGELVVDGALASPVTFRLAQQQTQVSIWFYTLKYSRQIP